MARIITITLLLGLAPVSFATSTFPVTSQALTTGNNSFHSGISSTYSNPALPSAAAQMPRSAKYGGGINIGGAIEYGNVDDIFDLLETINKNLNDKGEGSDGGDSGGSTPPGNGLPEPGTLPSNPTLSDIIAENPEFEEWLVGVAAKAAFFTSALVVISEEAYAKAYAELDAPMLISNDFFGGSLNLGFNISALSKARGIVDPFEWDTDNARSTLRSVSTLTASDPITTYNLSDNVIITVDPATEDIDIDFLNESLLLTKAAEISQFHINYSRLIHESEQGKLHAGIKPKILHVGLSQVGIRLGDLTDPESAFDNIGNTELDYDTELSLDLGAYWVTNIYSVGLSAENIFSPEFQFQEIDTTKYRKQSTIDRLRKESSWEMDAQMTIEGNLYTPDLSWILSASYDINSTQDIMGDEYQWASLSGQYQASSLWVPDFRIGYRSNLTGNDLDYVSLGTTIARVFTLDLTSTLNTIDIDGQTLPRGMGINMGLMFAF